jgi:hypothetical protein
MTNDRPGAPKDWLAPPAPPAPKVAPVAAVAAPIAPVAAPPLHDTLIDEPLLDPDAADDAELDDAELDDAELTDAEIEEAESPEPAIPWSERLKRTPPALVILTLAAVLSTGFELYELSTRTAPISILTSAAVVMGLVYVIVAVVATVATYRAATDGRAVRSYVLALVGGISALVAAGSFAGALILFLALGF